MSDALLYAIARSCLRHVGRLLDYRGGMSVAVCPGSFDPMTLGHLNVIERTSVLFDDVVVALASNAAKSALLGAAERYRLVERAVRDLPNVRVVVVPGLLVDFCREVGAVAVVKGLRSGADLDAELPMALMNRHLSGVETMFIPADPAVTHISSSMVKDIARHGGPVDDLVPAGVGDAVRAALSAQASHL